MSIRGVSSDWIDILSGVPQGSVLGQVLFLTFINDLDSGIRSWILKFADDTKIFNRVSCTADVERLQQDLDTLITWSQKWQMLFNVSKCKFMHVGTMQLERQYFMNDQTLEVVTQEKDLEVLISNDLKVSQQCQQAYNRGSRIPGLLHRTIQYKHIDTVLRASKVKSNTSRLFD